MLDMGSNRKFENSCWTSAPDRQTRQVPPGVQSYIIYPVQVYIGTWPQCIPSPNKYMRVMNVVTNIEPKDIIFCGRKTRADDMSSELLSGIYCTSSRGDREQADRGCVGPFRDGCGFTRARHRGHFTRRGKLRSTCTGWNEQVAPAEVEFS
nr:uncharacterized protein LOC109431153 [Aedes albopictus]